MGTTKIVKTAAESIRLRKQISLVLSFAIAACFFMPLFKWDSFEMSGLNYVLSSHTPGYKYLLIIIPISALILFLGILNDDNDFPSAKSISIFPILALVFVYVLMYMNRGQEGLPAENANVFSDTYLGFWILLGLSFLLLIINQRKGHEYEA